MLKGTQRRSNHGCCRLSNSALVHKYPVHNTGERKVEAITRFGAAGSLILLQCYRAHSIGAIMVVQGCAGASTETQLLPKRDTEDSALPAFRLFAAGTAAIGSTSVMPLTSRALLLSGFAPWCCCSYSRALRLPKVIGISSCMSPKRFRSASRFCSLAMQPLP